MDMTRWTIGLALAWLIAITGCEQQPTEPETVTGTGAPATTQPARQDVDAVQKMLDDAADAGGRTAGADDLPAGHPPIEQQVPPGHPPMDSAGDADSPAGLTWSVPESWEKVQPASRMRLAQFAIPGEGEPGEIAVFHFPGTGGSVQANIDRWVGQFQTAEGQPIPPDEVEQQTFEANGLQMHTVELTGHMSLSPMMGGTGEPTKDEYRLLAGIVEMPNGHWFFKGTGPAETMAGARDDFFEFMRSIQSRE